MFICAFEGLLICTVSRYLHTFLHTYRFLYTCIKTLNVACFWVFIESTEYLSSSFVFSEALQFVVYTSYKSLMVGSNLGLQSIAIPYISAALSILNISVMVYRTNALSSIFGFWVVTTTDMFVSSPSAIKQFGSVCKYVSGQLISCEDRWSVVRKMHGPSWLVVTTQLA